MRLLEACFCGEKELHALRLATDLGEDSRYVACSRCELVFATHRQDATDIDAYYATFKVLERRDYAVYPPPQLFIDNQQRLSEILIGRLMECFTLSPGTRVLNLRCEAGIHLARLKELGATQLLGIDHFESNARYGQDLGVRIDLSNQITAPGPFDLILANHQLTHAIDPVGLLRDCVSRLSPDGAIFFYNEIEHMDFFARPSFYKPGIIDFHKQLLTRRSMTNLLAMAGLVPVKTWKDTAGIKWAAGANSLMMLARRGQGEVVKGADLAPVIRRANAINTIRSVSGLNFIKTAIRWLAKKTYRRVYRVVYRLTHKLPA